MGQGIDLSGRIIDNNWNLVEKQTIIAFFEGRCNAEEAAVVKDWLEKNPAVLEEYIGETEWNAFQTTNTLQPEVSERLWHRIDLRMRPGRISLLWYVKRIAAAAAVLFMLGVAWYFIFRPRSADKPVVATVVSMKEVFNNTAQTMELRLSDSSVVALMPNSGLSYPEQFDGTKRSVTLNGEAVFNITKDAIRPFSVYSNAVVTLVLGTRFTVKAYQRDQEIRVILHEGQVVVKPADTTFHFDKNESYLSPGDIFILDKSTGKVQVRNPKVSDTAFDKDQTTGQAGMKGNNWYLFNNQSLAGVLDQLQQIFNTTIVYNQSDIEGMTFIGKIDRTDSLENILHTIVLLNDLKLQKQHNRYIISK